MADFLIEYFSPALRRRTSFKMLIPNDRRLDIPGVEPAPEKFKTLFLLHGYTGNAGNWVPEYLPEKYDFAIVMPNAENSFYLDGMSTGHAFETMVAIELVDYVRRTFGLAMTPEETYIAGMSMGGFGALHTALAHPDRFGKIGALSSALVVHDIKNMKPGDDNGMSNYWYYQECFGDVTTAEERDCNPEVLIKKLKAAGTPIPQMYVCCGTEDFLIEHNRRFHSFLEKEGVDHIYRESKGMHDMVFWNEYIIKICDWMFGNP